MCIIKLMRLSGVVSIERVLTFGFFKGQVPSVFLVSCWRVQQKVDYVVCQARSSVSVSFLDDLTYVWNFEVHV